MVQCRTMARNILLSVALLLCCCDAPDAEQDCSAIALTTKMVEIGAFSNVRYTEEHAYGYTVMLWRAGSCLVGFFESSEGLAGDTPIGELEHVEYDGKTRLSFSARRRTSDHLYSFTGYLRGTRLVGVVTYTSKEIHNFKPVRTNIVLPRSKQEAEIMHGTATYGEWREKWAPVLRFRGPRLDAGLTNICAAVGTGRHADPGARLHPCSTVLES